MDASTIRSEFLSFFEERGHTVVPSSGLVPQNDPTLFFVNAGMVPFKDVFTGAEQRPYVRAASVQKCLRVSGKHNDLEVVGRTPRHHTFFEMLGNFSFGDYFKDLAVPLAWELLTERLKVDADRLWITVFEEDDEAFALWRDGVGVPEARIQRLGAKENFWAMGPTGPCGPCSEIHYDHGPQIDDDDRGPAFESPRYVEIWNNVFMQYEQPAEGPRFALPRPSIDTGMGLERIAAVLQGVYWNYDTDLFQPLIRNAAEHAGRTYGADDEADVALRVIADHARASAFLVADGIMPANEGRGYVLRRIMRRAIRFGVKLGIDKPFLYSTALEVVDGMAPAYPELASRRTFIEEVVRGEEERFRRTLDRGMKLLDTELETAEAGGQPVPGDVAFTLSDTYGFPLDLTRLIASERGVEVDADGFERALEAQRARGRKAWKGSGQEAVGALWTELAGEHGPTTFTGYDRDRDVGTVLALVRDDDGELSMVDRLEPGSRGIVVLYRTPFYAESGGQVGDTGTIAGFTVEDTTTEAGLHLHRGSVTGEALSTQDVVQAAVAGGRRDHTRRNHTGTHLLHAALRQVLGEHVTQKGSLVGPNRLRFDFSHHKPVEPAELERIEDLVNEQIRRNRAVQTTLEDLEEAVAHGAMALFGEKYDEQVRVVAVPGFSVELCGGTHVQRTGDIGLLRITSEGGIAAGVRRIEAQTGVGALEVVRTDSARLGRAAAALKTNPGGVVASIERMQKERKELERANKELQAQLSKHAAGALADTAREIGGIKVLAAEFDGDLKEQADRLRDQLGSSLVVLAARRGDRVQLLAAATRDIAGTRVHAGKFVQQLAPLVGGRGGGRPDMAQAGGKDPGGIPAALERAWTLAAEELAR